MTLIYLSLAWVAGIGLGYYFNVPLWPGLAGLLLFTSLFFTRRHRKGLAIAGAVIIIVVIAAGYSYTSLYSIDEGKLRYYNDTGTGEIRGKISADPDVRDKSVRLTVEAKEIKLGDKWQRVGGKALVTAPRYPVYRYDDSIDISGKLQTPANTGDFDYNGYLAHQGIYTAIDFPHIEVTKMAGGFSPTGWIYALRSDLAKALAEALPEPQAALAQGIILGIRSNIPADLQTDFNFSGSTHLLAISGMNIGIVAGILLGTGAWLFGRKHNLHIWVTLGVVWFYVALAGSNPPVAREAVMASMLLAGEALGRQRSGAIGLCLAGAVMTGIQPYVLGDASFQLSFLAMAGLLFIYPVIQGWVKKPALVKAENKGTLAALPGLIIDSLGVTLAAIIAVWPVLAHYFGYVSIVGPLATLLLTPALPLIIAAGTVTGFAGLLWMGGAQVAGWIAWVFLSYMIAVVTALGAAPFASIKIPSISSTIIAVYYALIAAALWAYHRWKKAKNPAAGVAGRMKASFSGFSFDKRLLLAPLMLGAVIVFYTASAIPDQELRVSFLDVGEGDAALIQQGSRQILVDGGPSPKAITAALGREMPFWDRTIDLSM